MARGARRCVRCALCDVQIVNSKIGTLSCAMETYRASGGGGGGGAKWTAASAGDAFGAAAATLARARGYVVCVGKSSGAGAPPNPALALNDFADHLECVSRQWIDQPLPLL